MALLRILFMAAFGLFSVHAFAAKTGEPAPAFPNGIVDTHGKPQSLSLYPGQYIVLEWQNPGCPYVEKHYDKTNNIPRLQKEWTSKGVVWLTVLSGKQGKESPTDVNKYMDAHHAKQTAVVLDPTGDLGHAYGAQTTPHLFVINEKGVLIYQGAIDNKPTFDKEDAPSKANSFKKNDKTYIDYLSLALHESKEEKKTKLTYSDTKAYGCSVKY